MNIALECVLGELVLNVCSEMGGFEDVESLLVHLRECVFEIIRLRV